MSQHTIELSFREPEKRKRPSGANFRCVTPPIDGIANSATARARLEEGAWKFVISKEVGVSSAVKSKG